MDYSTLFKFGLLSDAASSPYSNVLAPWASDADSYKPRRRESLPSTIDEISLIAPISATMTQDTTGSITSGDSSSLYFTVRKKRSSKEHRSFLSLDLAESQSLRSASLRKKESPRALRSATRTGIANAYIPAPTSSFMAMFSPPPPLSPPQSPMSTQSVPTGRRSSHLELPSSPTDSVASHRPTSYVTEMDHGHSSRLPPPHPPLPRSIPRRELSPMRFAAPSPPPLLHSHFDAFSIRSGVSNGVISRTSTISSGYRREQRTEALKHLEGRGADGALGRIKPRLSQNFMFLSDDEEENEGEELPSLGRGISVIVEEVDEMKADMEEAWARIVRDNVAEFSWYDGTPHASTLNVSTTETIEPQGDVNANIDEIFGLSPSSYASSPMTRTPSDKPRESKRSRRTKSPLPMMQPLPQPSIPLPKPSPNRSPARLYTPPSSRSPSHSPSFADPQSLPKPPAPPMHTRTSPGPSHSHPYDEHGIRLRTKSDVGSTSSRHQLLSADARARALRKGSAKAVPNAPSPRAPSNSRPRFLDVDNEDPSFIDMRDEPPDNDSHTDSWNSLFEVSCTA